MRLFQPFQLFRFGREFATVGNEDLGWIIEEPGEEVGWGVEKGGENRDEREVGDCGTEVAAGEKQKAGGGEGGEEAVRFLTAPAKTGEDVHCEGESVEPGDEKKKRDERKTEVEEDECAGKASESGDWAAGAVAGEAEEVDDLGGEEGDEAEFGGVVEGEDNVGDTGREHGGEEEVVFREGFGDVEKAEGDAADAEESEEVVVWREKAEDDVDEGKRDPEDDPEWGDFELVFWMAGWIFWLLVFLMASIRSRN